MFAIRPCAATCAPPAGMGRGRSCSCWSWPAHQAASPPTLQSAKKQKQKQKTTKLEEGQSLGMRRKNHWIKQEDLSRQCRIDWLIKEIIFYTQGKWHWPASPPPPHYKEDWQHALKKKQISPLWPMPSYNQKDIKSSHHFPSSLNDFLNHPRPKNDGRFKKKVCCKQVRGGWARRGDVADVRGLNNEPVRAEEM